MNLSYSLGKVREQDLTLRVSSMGRMFLKPIKCLVLKFINFFLHSYEVLLTFLLKFSISEFNSLRTLSKPSKQECKYRNREEPLLSFLAVFIHGISN